MNYNIRAIEDKKPKGEITAHILGALHEWFGVEEAVREYIRKSQDMTFWAAYVHERPIGPFRIYDL
ncbi:hypothetical protein [Sulfobacillus thermosulfidooxidans]|uniref:hypothetical protein n=1 Tax=Sulfobacillus thermosulfidooxidans TaxID=28034 RepID=UPI0006B51E9E|nr:hypothetical protein [Sulfobacillus thermosulfidooxidans]